MRAARERSDKVVRLRPRTTASQRWASGNAFEVRRRLSLLQGYADLMEGMSAAQSVQILQVMAEKIEELTMSLRPFLLGQLSATLSQAQTSIPEQAAKPKVS
jgi:hypothetical protein